MTPTPPSPSVREVAESLSSLDRELFLGLSPGWGSWMFAIGNDLCAKGLGTRRDGSIYFDTPLAHEVRQALLSLPEPAQANMENDDAE